LSATVPLAAGEHTISLQAKASLGGSGNPKNSRGSNIVGLVVAS
jgi:hypothetical protein